MNMKCFLINARAVLGVSAFVFSGAAQAAAGIPTIDITHITTSVFNQVESIAKWGIQFKQLQQQIDGVTGSRGMGGLMDNQAIKAALPADWKQILLSVKQTPAYAVERAKYPTYPGLPKTTAMYDVIAGQNVTMNDLYSKSNGRVSQVQSLMGQIDSANDPAAKADLTNRLISEQNAIQANQNLVAMLQTTQKQELEMASQQAAKEYSCKEFKRSGC